MAYQQNFIALPASNGGAGTTYTLTIGNWSGSTQPPLSDSPFETSEEADTDMFTPTRTQSGYIRMRSTDASTWRSFIPASVMDKPVTLTTGGTIVWQGYIQTGTYGMLFPANYEEIELPVICPISALESFDVDASRSAEMVTVGQLLNYIFSQLSGLSFTFYFHCYNVSTVNTWLGYKLSWRNFLSEEGNQLKARFTCLGLLQELCKFFGWTCRAKGQGIYFTCITDSARNSAVASYTLAQLASASSSSSASMKSATISNSAFASTDLNEEYIPGCKKVTVNSELNPYDVIMEIPYDDICRPHKYDTPALAQRWRNNIEDVTDVWLLYRASLSYENAQVAITSYTETGESSTEGRPMCYGRFIAFDGDTEDDKKKFSWTKCFECFISEDYGNRQSSTPLFTMESKAAVIVGDGVLFISGRSDGQSLSPLAQVDPNPLCTLKIGNLYWNGSAWTTTASTFYIEMKQNGIADTDTIFNNAEYDGMGIPITSPMTGKIYFAVHDIRRNTNWYNGYFPLMDFEIGFVRNGEEDELNDKAYTANGGNFPENVDVDTIFCTDKTNATGSTTFRCQAGYGFVYGGNQVIDTIPYGAASYKPEQHLADTIAAYGASVRRVLTLDLLTSAIGDIGPDYRVTLGGQQFYPVAISHQWRDNISTLKLMEI